MPIQDASERQPTSIVIVDDHEAILEGTLSSLQKLYPETKFFTAQTAQAAKEKIDSIQPDLVVMDLSIPPKPQEMAQTEVGIQLLRSLMKEHPQLNFVVQSAHVRSLVRLKPAIEIHQGGFTISDKSSPMREMLTRVDWALQGLVYTPREMRTNLEVKPEWLEVLQLAFQDGLQDKAIAEQMNVSERTVRHYWTRVQDALGVYPDEGKNIRIQTEIRARQEGLLD
ncbi:MAG: response regulator transcription factor [Cyanobacteria bacterium J06635_15]